MTEHEYTFMEVSWGGNVIRVNGALPEPPKKIWELVNSLGAAGWRVAHVTPIGWGTTKGNTIWVVLHRESHGPEPL